MTMDFLYGWLLGPVARIGFVLPDPEPLDHPDIQKMGPRELADLPYAPVAEAAQKQHRLG